MEKENITKADSVGKLVGKLWWIKLGAERKKKSHEKFKRDMNKLKSGADASLIVQS